MRAPTQEELDTLRITDKGCTKAKLAEWGIEWPPKKGWKRRLLNGEWPLAEKVGGFSEVKIPEQYQPILQAVGLEEWFKLRPRERNSILAFLIKAAESSPKPLAFTAQ